MFHCNSYTKKKIYGFITLSPKEPFLLSFLYRAFCLQAVMGNQPGLKHSQYVVRVDEEHHKIFRRTASGCWDTGGWAALAGQIIPTQAQGSVHGGCDRALPGTRAMTSCPGTPHRRPPSRTLGAKAAPPRSARPVLVSTITEGSLQPRGAPHTGGLQTSHQWSGELL